MSEYKEEIKTDFKNWKNKKEIYTNLDDLNNKKIIDSNWSYKGGRLQKSSLHSIASYLAMFAPSLPEYFIDKYSKEGEMIFDPFSGRGTTALRARELNRRFVGSDLNPYALVLTKFKISKIKKENIIKRLHKWKKQYLKNPKKWLDKTRDNKYKELLYYYHKTTLSMLLFIREEIGYNWKNTSVSDNALLAITLGIMHGKTRKSGDTIYFSVSMPNTISLAPNYVNKYVKKHNLKIPNVNVFQNIENRINFKYDDLLRWEFEGKIYDRDATKKNRYIKNESVDLVVTSPPYLSIVNYTSSNWLKLWLLGYERKELKQKIQLTDNLKFDKYIIFIKNLLNNTYLKLKMGAKVCLIVGDVYEIKVIEEVWKNIKNSVSYKFIEIYYDVSYLQKCKVTNMLNKKKGKATKIEKVLVVEKI